MKEKPQIVKRLGKVPKRKTIVRIEISNKTCMNIYIRVILQIVVEFGSSTNKCQTCSVLREKEMKLH